MPAISPNIRFSRPGQPRPLRRISGLPVALLGLGLLITTGMAIQNNQFNRRLHEQAEIALLDDVSDALMARMAAVSASVASVSAMAETNGSLTPERFRHYVEDLRNAQQLPEGILGLGYAEYVPLAERVRFEASLSAAYGQKVRIRPEGVRPAYAPVSVLLPLDHRNSRAIGFDLLSEPVRRESLLQASRSGNPVLTSKLQLMQNTLGDQQPGAILYAVIRRHRHSLPPSSGSIDNQVWGWASSPVLIHDLMEATLRSINNPNLPGSTVLLFDGDQPGKETRLYDPAEIFGTPRLTDPSYQRIAVGGRHWLVGVQLTRALPGPDGLHWTQALILLVGALISVLVAMVSRELLLSHLRTMEALQQLSEAAEEQAIAAAVFEGTVEGVVITNPEGKVLSLNQSFTQLTGYSNLDLRGRSLRILRSGKHDNDFYADLWEELRREGSWHHEIWNRCKHGSIRLHDVSITTVTDQQLQPLHYVAMYRDITDRHAEQQAILHQATHDPLTGLANRTLLVDHLNQAIAMAQRYGNRVALMYMDLDGLKAVNDTLGHDVGDELLIAVARRLERFVRKTDTLCRQGGDEFVLLLPHAPDFHTLIALANRIRTSLREPFTSELRAAVLQISVSIGIARYPEHGSHCDDLMQAADRAMYHSKKSDDHKPVLAESPTPTAAG